MDMSLDQMMSEEREKRKNSSSRGRGRGGRGGGRGRGGAATRGSQPAPIQVVVASPGAVGPVRNKYSGNIAVTNSGGKVGVTPAAAVPLMADGSKIIVSNLPQDVTENQVRDLFSQTVGPVTRISLAYDKNGKSTGVATIELKRPGDAQVAFGQYNGRLVDGTRPMKVEILFDPTRLPPPPLTSRIGPNMVPSLQVAVMPKLVASSGGPKSPAATRGGAGGGGRGGRGRGRGGKRGGGEGGEQRGPVTADDLDAEMEDYQKTLSSTA